MRALLRATADLRQANSLALRLGYGLGYALLDTSKLHLFLLGAGQRAYVSVILLIVKLEEKCMGGHTSGSNNDTPLFESLRAAQSMGNATGLYSREVFATILERQPVARVQAAVKANQINPKNLPQALEWLDHKEAELTAKQSAREDSWREREIAAAETSAEAAKVSAEEARRNSRIAMGAAFIAMIAAIISCFKS